MRVSTVKQTTEPQQLELRSYCAAKGWHIVHEFADVISGTKAKRPGLDAALCAARAGEFAALVSLKIDRLARSTSHFLRIAEELRECGVAMVCTSQGIDTRKESAAGQMMAGILAVFASFERDLISERTRDGLAVARAAGVRFGRRPLPWSAAQAAILAGWSGQVRPLATALGVSRSKAGRLLQARDAQACQACPETNL